MHIKMKLIYRLAHSTFDSGCEGAVSLNIIWVIWTPVDECGTTVDACTAVWSPSQQFSFPTMSSAGISAPSSSLVEAIALVLSCTASASVGATEWAEALSASGADEAATRRRTPAPEPASRWPENITVESGSHKRSRSRWRSKMLRLRMEFAADRTGNRGDMRSKWRSFP